MSTKTVKAMLIDLYKEEREQERCAIVHELKEDAKKIIHPYRDHVIEWEDDISTLNKQISDIRRKINEHIKERDNELRKVKLYTFTHQACGDALHEDLARFDKETTKHIRDILEGEK